MKATFGMLWAATFLMVPTISVASQPDVIDLGDKVTIAFAVTVPEEGITIPQNISQYVSGEHQLLPSVEQALLGLKEGEEKRVEVRPEEGFGPYDEQKKLTIPRNQVPPDAQVGGIYETPTGQPFVVQALTSTHALIDFNHPLAGKHVVLDVRILKIEDRTSSEVAPQQAGMTPRVDASIMTFNTATVQDIDKDHQALRIQTQNGQTWWLQVTQDDLLKGVKPGDRVRLELNSHDQVKTIVKTEGGS